MMHNTSTVDGETFTTRVIDGRMVIFIDRYSTGLTTANSLTPITQLDIPAARRFRHSFFRNEVLMPLEEALPLFPALLVEDLAEIHLIRDRSRDALEAAVLAARRIPRAPRAPRQPRTGFQQLARLPGYRSVRAR